jgi:hypothetical protein
MVSIRKGNCLLVVFTAAYLILPFEGSRIWIVVGAIAAESTNWLINNPASMMDWGSQKAERSAQRAADSLNKQMEAREKQDFDLQFDSSISDEVKRQIIEDRKAFSSPQQYGYRYEAAYAGYDQPKDRVVVGVFVVPHFSFQPGKIDVESCTGIVEDFRKRMLIFGETKDGVKKLASSWFAHTGYSSRVPPNFVDDLLEHIAVVINLHEYVTLDAKVKCEQPLLGDSITSVVNKKS